MVRRAASRARMAAGGALAVAFAACTPTFTDATSIVSGPRLLAVQATPAEAATGKPFALKGLYVGPGGAQDASAVDWAICLLPNPLGDPDPIAPGCFVETSSSLTPLGDGASVAGTIPSNACQLFGPDAPTPAPGQPAARPTDPDATGGFYLPIRIHAGGDWSAATERIACAPNGVTLPVLTAFSNGYVPNENPALASLARVGSDGGATDVPPDGSSGGARLTVAAGTHVTLRAAWAPCGSAPAACSGAEPYLYIDPATKQVATARESIVASFYASGGAFDLDRVGREGADTATTADNGWTAPSEPGQTGEVHLWVVLRDSRGGVGWEAYTIAVQ